MLPQQNFIHCKEELFPLWIKLAIILHGEH